MSKLPISLSSKPSKVRITESREVIKPRSSGLYDDEVDENLLRLAGLDN